MYWVRSKTLVGLFIIFLFSSVNKLTAETIDDRVACSMIIAKDASQACRRILSNEPSNKEVNEFLALAEVVENLMAGSKGEAPKEDVLRRLQISLEASLRSDPKNPRLRLLRLLLQERFVASEWKDVEGLTEPLREIVTDTPDFILAQLGLFMLEASESNGQQFDDQKIIQWTLKLLASDRDGRRRHIELTERNDQLVAELKATQATHNSSQVESQRRLAEADEARRVAEAELRRQLAEAEAARKATEAESQRNIAEAETQRKLAEAEAARKATEAEAKLKLALAEAATKNAEERVKLVIFGFAAFLLAAVLAALLLLLKRKAPA